MKLQIYLVSGGYTGYTGVYLDSTELYNPGLYTWANVASLPSPMGGLRAVNIDNRILVFGKNIKLM